MSVAYFTKQKIVRHNRKPESKASTLNPVATMRIINTKELSQSAPTLTIPPDKMTTVTWYQGMEIEKDSYNCECEELETVGHILVECPLLDVQQQGLKRVSPEMDLPTLLNSATGLQKIVDFITIQRD